MASAPGDNGPKAGWRRKGRFKCDQPNGLVLQPVGNLAFVASSDPAQFPRLGDRGLKRSAVKVSDVR